MLAKIKDKFQVTLPIEVRKQGQFSVGDYVDVGLDENNRITLTAKSVVDRAIAQGREDFKNGKYEMFESAEDMIEFLHKGQRQKRRRR